MQKSLFLQLSPGCPTYLEKESILTTSLSAYRSFTTFGLGYNSHSTVILTSLNKPQKKYMKNQKPAQMLRTHNTLQVPVIEVELCPPLGKECQRSQFCFLLTPPVSYKPFIQGEITSADDLEHL